MAMDTLAGINAYRNQMKMMQQAGDSTEASGDTENSAFAQVLQSAMGTAENSLKTAEATQIAALTGKVELTDLVTAVADAELSLNTVVAVRDRVIGAYNDIIRMAI